MLLYQVKFDAHIEKVLSPLRPAVIFNRLRSHHDLYQDCNLLSLIPDQWRFDFVLFGTEAFR